MARFYEQLAGAVAAGEPFALALISGVKGSSPQRVGAKALFFADGRIVGTLGGGCLEAEVQARAIRSLKTGAAATYQMVLDHDFGWDDGLICGGSVAGLILPRVAEAAEVWRELARGESAREWGVRGDFSIGWVEGAGEFEFPSGKGYDRPHPGLLPQEKERNSPPHPDTTISLAEQPGVREEEERGGGWLYREKVTPPPALWIAGSGHVAQVVAPLALQLEFEVTVFDDRPELANHERFPAAARLRVGGWHELLQEPMPGQPAFGLIVTRGHQHDALVLSDWIHRPFVFLGMIGSRRKARVIREQFVRQKLATAEAMARVACPVGLDILAQSTAEIGVSIVGELVRKRAEWRRTSGG